MKRILLFPLCIVLLASSRQTSTTQAQQPCRAPVPTAASREPNIFSEQQEVDLGDAVAEHIQRDFRVIDDEEVTGYLQQIGRRIVKHLPPNSLNFRFFLVDLPDA